MSFLQKWSCNVPVCSSSSCTTERVNQDKNIASIWFNLCLIWFSIKRPEKFSLPCYSKILTNRGKFNSVINSMNFVPSTAAFTHTLCFLRKRMKLQKEILTSFRSTHFNTDNIREVVSHFLSILIDNTNAFIFIVNSEFTRRESDTLALLNT